MTAAETFRKEAGQVQELESILQSPVMRKALGLVIGNHWTNDVAEDADSLASVRRLSYLTGRADVIRELAELATPLPVSNTEPLPTFGVTDPPPAGWSPENL